MFYSNHPWRNSIFTIALTLSSFFVLPAVGETQPDNGLATLQATQAGFHAIQAQVAPAVVTIVSSLRGGQATGSGVIIKPEGIILTNRHVVDGATKVTVQLNNQTTQLAAKVIQTDEKTDLAIVKISEKGTYPTAQLGDAKTVEVGHFAIAFGSPLGLPSTMTVGVISATGRKLEGPVGDFNYYDLLQTDAAINHGNSGGPLVNIYGQIIGINFMIFSGGETGGNIGIGFAIPINDYTKKVIDTLIAGKIFARGLIGIQVDSLSPAMRDTYGVPTGGILVQAVMAGGAGEKAGVKVEDVITDFNGVTVTDPDQFVKMVQGTTPGTKLQIIVVREKKSITLDLTLGSDKNTDMITGGWPGDAPVLNKALVGISVITLTPAIAHGYDLAATSGVLVTDVADGSPAADAGLAPGDVIQRVDKTDVSSTQEFWATLSKQMATSKFGVLLHIMRGDKPRIITLAKITPPDDNK